ncbi:hypothetical protein [uncultured Sulfitobacter sp.]|uniref:hypothetical protein n=1 Tax=uncultured Sulfitobacter sp. TaxID=191468 RepID=UPI002619A957|nr:hypothetical protein [uncultured Sulfitobacter sp.]
MPMMRDNTYHHGHCNSEKPWRLQLLSNRAMVVSVAQEDIMNTKPIRSPAYPSLSLNDAVEAVEKIETQYRGSSVDRIDAAKLIGYASGSGPANKALAALASFGLVERAGKGMMRVTGRARSILHPDSADEKIRHLREAALEPKLFQEIKGRFEDIDVPPMEGVVTFLNREGFNPSAVGPAAKAFINTMVYIQSFGDSESHGKSDVVAPSSTTSSVEFGGAAVGDKIQWESGGVLQFETPKAVRWVSDDGAWLAVEGSETGIPMNEVTIESPAASISAPPIPPMARPSETPLVEGFSEWFRAKVGSDKLVTINFKGEGEIGPREIEKMIRVLEAQKLALED